MFVAWGMIVFRTIASRAAFFPSVIGNHVVIDEDTVISSQNIGSYVHIGKNCVIVIAFDFLWPTALSSERSLLLRWVVRNDVAVLIGST